MKSFNEFMSEMRLVNRWTIVVVALSGAFAGAILMFMVSLLGLVTI